MSAATYVYVISGDHGRQKIGVTDYPSKRLKELQTGSPFPLRFEFVGLTDGTGFDIEGEAHFILNSHRQSGEWFVVPPDVAITAVMAAASRLGHKIRPVDPDNVSALSRALPIGGQTTAAWTKWSLSMAVFFVILLWTDHFLTALVVSMLSALFIRSATRAATMFRLAAVAVTLFGAGHAKAADVRCDTPGVAQMVIPGMFAKNPSAQKLDAAVTSVTVIGLDDGGSCIVWAETNRDYAIKYRFAYDGGEAALDMLDIVNR